MYSRQPFKPSINKVNDHLVAVQISPEDLKKVSDALKVVEDTLTPFGHF
jgi:hypothetical protein